MQNISEKSIRKMYQKKRYMKNLSEKYNFSKWNVFVLWEVPVCTIGCQFSSGVKKKFYINLECKYKYYCKYCSTKSSLPNLHENGVTFL